MVKYGYMYNDDGIDKLNVNVYDNTESEAESMAYATNPSHSEYGTTILINHPDKFRDKIESLPESFRLAGKTIALKNSYIGYYYDTKLDSYVIDESAIHLAAEPVYAQIADDLIKLKQLDPKEITNEMEDGQFKDTENVVINHEGGVITLNHKSLTAFKLRLMESNK